MMMAVMGRVSLVLFVATLALTSPSIVLAEPETPLPASENPETTSLKSDEGKSPAPDENIPTPSASDEPRATSPGPDETQATSGVPDAPETASPASDGPNLANPASDEPKATSDTPNAPETASPRSEDPAEKTSETETQSTSLTIASWGGAYSRSQEIAYFKPFAEATGADVKLVSHGGRASALDRMAKQTETGWDVVDLASSMIGKACDDGLLEPIDLESIIQTGVGEPAREDFLPGALHECGIASVAWSSVIVYDRNAFKKRKPRSARDFFDLKRFPGKRALRRGPKYSLELALMADGVGPQDVYGELATEAGLERAFAMLDKVKESVVWWTRGHEPLKRLVDKDVTMATAYNGRVFNVVVTEHAPIAIIWDRQIYDVDLWAIPKTASNKRAARNFISFAMKPDRLAAQTQWFPYGPMRKSAVALVGKHAEVDVEMATFIPTTGKNFETALKLDEAWWSGREKELTERFEAWIRRQPGATPDAESEAKTSE